MPQTRMIEIVVAGRLSRDPLFSLAAGYGLQHVDRPLSTPLSGACAQARLAYYARLHIGVDLSFAAIRRMI